MSVGEQQIEAGAAAPIGRRGEHSLGAHAAGARSLIAFLAILCAIGAFRIVALAFNGTELYMDEAQYWAWSRDLSFGYFSKPPLIAWLIYGTTSVCGDSEFCIRAPALALHLVTAVIVYALAARLYSDEVAFWSGLGYALLPAVSLSSGIISTDVPLLAAWALALFAFAGVLSAPTLGNTALLAAAIGVGLNAKYAMAYFIVCAAVYFVLAPERRQRLAHPALWLALGGGLLLILPNIVWNFANGFATVNHTVENANWQGVSLHPGKALEFLLAQFGVFGPILFGALLVIVWRAVRQPADLAASDKLLIAFSVPILVLVTTQGLISRAHANWAAPAYVAAVILVTAVMVRDGARIWMRASFAINGALALLIAAATWQAGRFSIPGIGDPFARTLGSRALADVVRQKLATAERNGDPLRSVVTNERETAAVLAYYARDVGVPILSWRSEGAPRSYFEMTRPFSPGGLYPVLFVTQRAPLSAPDGFVSSHETTQSVAAGRHANRVVHTRIVNRVQSR